VAATRQTPPDHQLTDKVIRRGIFNSVPDRVHAIESYLAAHNSDPTPFPWTAASEQIIEKILRGEQPRCNR
jgi:hypothetical protein